MASDENLRPDTLVFQFGWVCEDIETARIDVNLFNVVTKSGEVLVYKCGTFNLVSGKRRNINQLLVEIKELSNFFFRQRTWLPTG